MRAAHRHLHRAPRASDRARQRGKHWASATPDTRRRRPSPRLSPPWGLIPPTSLGNRLAACGSVAFTPSSPIVASSWQSWVDARSDGAVIARRDGCGGGSTRDAQHMRKSSTNQKKRGNAPRCATEVRKREGEERVVADLASPKQHCPLLRSLTKQRTLRWGVGNRPIACVEQAL